MKRLAVAGMLLVILGRYASAADVFLPIPVKAAPVQAAYDWTGFYVGGHVAYSLGHAHSTLSDPNPITEGNSFGSPYGGLQAGYNYVLPSRLFLGAEADITFPDFLENGAIFGGGTAKGTSVTNRIDYVGTFRGRFGYALDHWLVYGTGGFAWSQARFIENPGIVNDEDKVIRTRMGWALGFGAEVAIAPAWSVRFEYLYDRFGSVGGVFQSGTAYQSAFDIQMLRIGLAASSAPRSPTQRGVRAVIRGRSPPAAGMSMANSHSLSRAIPRSARHTKVQTASSAGPSA